MYDTRTGFSGELLSYIFEAYAIVPAAERRVSHWVMNAEWFTEVRRVAGPDGGSLWHPSFTLGAPETLLGLPIEVRDDGGAPLLEQ